MKKIAVLGSTGSIGKNTLAVAKYLNMNVRALAAHSNIDLLEKQAHQFHPECIAVFDTDKALELQKRLPEVSVVGGMEGLIEAATQYDTEFVVSAMVGTRGILPTLKAIESGKTIGLANKEVLISAGELIMGSAQRKRVKILPIDSEHSAIFQCLQGEYLSGVRRIVLTASGGPFLKRDDLEGLTPSCALKHPTWVMGKKVTIDSSTLMNKGLEVIEAKFLFDIPVEKIDVVVHPQSLIHSLVEFVDGSLLSQIGEHDMKIPIQYALTYPKREKRIAPCFDFLKYSKLEFCMPDWGKFPCLRLAYEAAKTGGTLPCFMNAANEILVERFLGGEIEWLDIGKKLETLMAKHTSVPQENLEILFDVEQSAREMAMCE